MEKLFKKPLFPHSINHSLRAKVTLVIIIPMFLMLAIFMIYEYTRHRSIMLENLSDLASYNGLVLEETLRHSMQVADFANVQRTVDSVGVDRKFHAVYLLDLTGRVVVAPNGNGEGLILKNSDASCQPCHSLAPSLRPSGVVVNASDGQEVFRSMKPVMNGPSCTQCHDASQRILGLLLIDISVAPFEASITREMQVNLLLGIGAILISILIANLGLERLVIRRLKGVENALSSFGGGGRNIRIAKGSFDEIGRLEEDFNEMAQHIQGSEAQNLELSEALQRRTTEQQVLLKQLITAQEDERKRVARELHDELGQSLSGLSLHSEVMAKYIPSNPERALEELSLTRKMIGATTQQMYELILDLRPSVLDDLGLAAALHSLVERTTSESGIDVRLDFSALTRRLPNSIEITLYRIFQEGLRNAVIHSGANQVKIALALQDGHFEGDIVDNGCGFDPDDIPQDPDNPHCLGLMGMRERVSQCRGSIEIISRPGQGTRIHVQIPLAEG